MCLSQPAGFFYVSTFPATFLSQNNKKLYSFLHALQAFYEQSHFLTEAFSCKPLVNPLLSFVSRPAVAYLD